MRFNGLELIVVPTIIIMAVAGIMGFSQAAKQNIARAEARDAVASEIVAMPLDEAPSPTSPVVVSPGARESIALAEARDAVTPEIGAPTLDEAPSPSTVALWALAIPIGVVFIGILWMEFEMWRASRGLQKSARLAAARKRAEDEARSKRAKIEARRASCAALAAKTSSIDLRVALNDFIAANKRWADGRASGSYGDNPRLRHAVEVVESACLRVLSDTSLMSSEDAHLRLVEPLRRATGQLNAEMSSAVTAKLEDMSIDLHLAQRVFEGVPSAGR